MLPSCMRLHNPTLTRWQAFGVVIFVVTLMNLGFLLTDPARRGMPIEYTTILFGLFLGYRACTSTPEAAVKQP